LCSRAMTAVWEESAERDMMITIETDGTTGAAEVIIGGHDQNVLDHRKADIDSALKLLGSFADDHRVVPGAALTYLELSKKLRRRALDVWGPERLAILAFSTALSRIGMSLIKGFGDDPLKGLDMDRLKALEASGIKGEASVEPVSVPRTVMNTSSELAASILRIDDVISAGKLHESDSFGGGGGNVTVYTTPSCPWCSRVKSYLRSKGISFVEKDVSSDMAAAQEMYSISGQMGTPVTRIGSEVIVGFDQAKLDRLT